jgi:hypothetical protein
MNRLEVCVRGRQKAAGEQCRDEKGCRSQHPSLLEKKQMKQTSDCRDVAEGTRVSFGVGFVPPPPMSNLRAS